MVIMKDKPLYDLQLNLLSRYHKTLRIYKLPQVLVLENNKELFVFEAS